MVTGTGEFLANWRKTWECGIVGCKVSIFTEHLIHFSKESEENVNVLFLLSSLLSHFFIDQVFLML